MVLLDRMTGCMVKLLLRICASRQHVGAALCVLLASGAAQACSPDFLVNDNPELQELSQGFYKGDSLWSATKAPPVPRKTRRGAVEEGEALLDIPCPDKDWTRTPDVDLTYEPAAGPIDMAILFQRLNLLRLTRSFARPEPAQVPALPALVPTGLPLVAVDVPPVVADTAALPVAEPERAPVVSALAPGAPSMPDRHFDTPTYRTAGLAPPTSLRIPPAQRDGPADTTSDRPAQVDKSVPVPPKPAPAEVDAVALALASADAAVSEAEALLARAEPPEAASDFGGSVRLMTGDDFRPFNDRSLTKGGLITEVLGTAIAAVVARDKVEILWVDDWAAQIAPMLAAQDVEMAFPVPKPDCASAPNSAVCADFLFSEPIFEYFVQLFVDARNPIRFTRDSDLEGRRICRPAGLPNHMLDEAGRDWLSGNKITLEQPPLVTDCFFMLVEGEVDGVILNRFTARETILGMGLDKRVTAIAEHPISISGLHAVVRKDNPKAEALMDVVNRGLAQIREDGRFGEIVSRHLQDIWDRI